MKSLVLKISLGIAGVLLVFVLYFRAGNLWEIVQEQERLTRLMNGHRIIGLLLLYAGLFLQVFLAIIPGHILMMVAGKVYGIVQGALINASATMFASQLAFLLARKFGLPFVKRFVPDHMLTRVLQKLEHKGFLFYIIALWLPSSDIFCFVAGLSSISPKMFLVVNFLGRLPTSVLMSLVGAYSYRLSLQTWAFILISLIVSLLLGKLVIDLVQQLKSYALPNASSS